MGASAHPFGLVGHLLEKLSQTAKQSASKRAGAAQRHAEEEVAEYSSFYGLDGSVKHLNNSSMYSFGIFEAQMIYNSAKFMLIKSDKLEQSLISGLRDGTARLDDDWLRTLSAYQASTDDCILKRDRTLDILAQRHNHDDWRSWFETENIVLDDPFDFIRSCMNGEDWAKRFEEQESKQSSEDMTLHLGVIGIADVPSDLVTLKSAFQQAMKKAHPDVGGSHDAAIAVMNAYEFLKARITNVN